MSYYVTCVHNTDMDTIQKVFDEAAQRETGARVFAEIQEGWGIIPDAPGDEVYVMSGLSEDDKHQLLRAGAKVSDTAPKGYVAFQGKGGAYLTPG